MSPYLKTVYRISDAEAPSLNLAYDLFALDRCLQSILFRFIGLFELQLRSQYANAMGERYGAFPQYNESLFLRKATYYESMKIYRHEVDGKAKKNRALAKKIERNGGMLPIWHAVELLSLGTLSRFFSNTKDNDATRSISHSFNASKTDLSSWIKTIVAVRNICAHFDHFVVRRQIPSIPKPIVGVECENTSPFYIVLILARILDAEPETERSSTRNSEQIKSDTQSIFDCFFKSHNSLSTLPGIPKNWKSLLNN